MGIFDRFLRRRISGAKGKQNFYSNSANRNDGGVGRKEEGDRRLEPDLTSEKEWYIISRKGKKKEGPYSIQELKERFDKRKPNTRLQIRKLSNSEWCAWSDAGIKYPELVAAGILERSPSSVQLPRIEQASVKKVEPNETLESGVDHLNQLDTEEAQINIDRDHKLKIDLAAEKEWYIIPRKGRKKEGPFSIHELKKRFVGINPGEGLKIRKVTDSTWCAWVNVDTNYPELAKIDLFAFEPDSGSEKSHQEDRILLSEPKTHSEEMVGEIVSSGPAGQNPVPESSTELTLSEHKAATEAIEYHSSSRLPVCDRCKEKKECKDIDFVVAQVASYESGTLYAGMAYMSSRYLFVKNAFIFLCSSCRSEIGRSSIVFGVAQAFAWVTCVGLFLLLAFTLPEEPAESSTFIGTLLTMFIPPSLIFLMVIAVASSIARPRDAAYLGICENKLIENGMSRYKFLFWGALSGKVSIKNLLPRMLLYHFDFNSIFDKLPKSKYVGRYVIFLERDWRKLSRPQK